jgi:hypothetical protein
MNGFLNYEMLLEEPIEDRSNGARNPIKPHSSGNYGRYILRINIINNIK